jgi:ribosomal protein S18 acetylase RimI-like enzyme
MKTGVNETNFVRSMQPVDVRQVVRVHMRAFPGFFLSFLGERFLRELYDAIIGDPTGLAFVYSDNEGVRGFVAGTTQPSGFYKRLIRQRVWRFGAASILPMIKKPAILPRLLRAFSMPAYADTGEGCAKLMSIAIIPEAQGKRIGKNLLYAFLEEARRRGMKQVDLETDRLDNDATNQFYLRNGFSLYRSYTTPEGREMNEYRIIL